MKKVFHLLIIFLIGASYSHAQNWNFEKELPRCFSASDNQEIAISKQFYKDGAQSLEWKFRPNSMLTVNLAPYVILNKETENKYGITLWIYNEKPQKDSLQFQFLSPTGHISYKFAFKLSAAGWRACWIGFQHMHGDKQDKTIARWRIIAPEREGRKPR